jgi:hypothetical protein
VVVDVKENNKKLKDDLGNTEAEVKELTETNEALKKQID